MKKVLSVILCITVIFCCCTVGLAELTDPVDIDPIITKRMDKTAKEWMSSDENRALLTVCMTLDYLIFLNGNAEFNIDLLNNNSYSGRLGFNLFSIYYIENEKKGLMIIYNTRKKDCGYSFIKSLSKDELEYAMKLTCKDGLYKNDVSDLYAVLEELRNAMGF